MMSIKHSDASTTDDVVGSDKVTKKRKRMKQRTVLPRNDDKKTRDLDVGTRLELYWEPTESWSQAQIKWNWGDGSYVIECEDDENKHAPLTYYIDHYKYRYSLPLSDEDEEEEPPKKKQKISKKSKRSKKAPKVKPQKAKLCARKTRSKKRKKKTRKLVRREPNYSRTRVEKLYSDEVQNIEDVEDSFTDFSEKLLMSSGLRRLSLEAFRAVHINDAKLMKTIFRDKENVADPWINWSCNIKKNCLDLAIKKNNLGMIRVLLKFKKKPKYAQNRIALRHVEARARLSTSSGHVGKATFGHKVRALNASRGGKEGNNAFVKDCNVELRTMEEHLSYALQCGANIEICRLFMSEVHSRPAEHISDHGLLYKAAEMGRIDLVRQFIDLLSSQNNDKGKSFGLNMLHGAVVQGEYNDLGEFRNVSIHKKALEGNNSITPLHLAAINPNIGYLKQMVQQWHSSKDDFTIVDHTDDLRRTPLFFAAANASPEALQYLIECGAKLDVKGLVARNNANDEISPLLIAVKYGKTHNIKFLLGADKDLDKAKEIVNESLDSRSNKKLLHVASYYGHAEVVAELLEFGADPKATMKGTKLSAMHLAAQRGHLDACRVLTEHRLSARNKRGLVMKDKSKRIPLVCAITNGHLDIVKYMLQSGAPAYAADSSGNSAIHYAAAYGWNDILKCLMEAPFANPGVENMWKLSPFFIAMIKGNDLCASTLLDTKDFDVNAVDSDGKSILHYMLENKNFNPQKTLNHLKRIVTALGANVNVKIPKTKQYPLHILADNTPSDKDSEMALILMQKGARPDYQDTDGRTPISLAIQRCNWKLFETLIVSFDVNTAGKPQKTIDWTLPQKEQKEEKEEHDGEVPRNRELNLNTSLRNSWLTPLHMAIQLTPPKKTPQKPKQYKNKQKQKKLHKKRKEKLLMQHGANRGLFVATTFDQAIDLESHDSLSSSESSSDEEKQKQIQKEEEEKEKERNQIGETEKQIEFRANRLKMIRLICNALDKYNDLDDNALLNTWCKKGKTALFYAAQAQCYQGTDGYKVNYGSVEITDALILMGADPDVMNHKAETVVTHILENASNITNIIEILKPIMKTANVNKRLVIYHKDKKKKKEIKVRRDSYLTTAVSTLLNDSEYDAKTVYNVIKLLIEQGAKLEVENETPIVIKLIEECHNNPLFQASRFENKYVADAGNETDCIGFELISFLMECAHDPNIDVSLDLNVHVANPNANVSKSLLSFAMSLIAVESQSQQNALFNVMNVVEGSYSGRDQRVVKHKKKLYRDRVLAIPLISEAILAKLLSFTNCKIAINEREILEAIKLSSLEGTLKSQNVFDAEFEKEFEPLPWRVCNMLLKNGKINFKGEDERSCNPLIDALKRPNKDLRRRLLRLLIDYGMNINRQDKRGVTLVHAMKQDDYEAIQLLVENGLNVNNCGWSVYDDTNCDKPNKIAKHPLVELVHHCNGQPENHRSQMLDAVLSQKGIDVELQNGFCVTATKMDDLICHVNHDMERVSIEFIEYKYKNEEENKWMLTKTFCVDHLALFAYKSAYQLFKKHYKQGMEKRFSSPLWKQSIEILINCNWSLSKATQLFQQFRFKLTDAIKVENNRRKLIRANYDKQVKYMAKIHKKKGKSEEEEETRTVMDVDEDDESDPDMDVSMNYVDSDDSLSSVSSLDSEERNAIDSDDEMKKLEDYRSELKDDVDPEAIKEADLAPLIEQLCAHWKYTKTQYVALVKKWYYAHQSLVVGDSAWQLCREQARNDETQRRRQFVIETQRKKLKHLKDLRKEWNAGSHGENDSTVPIVRQMIRQPDFTILEEREQQIKEWKKAKKHGEPPLITEAELEKANGVDCTQKVGSHEIKSSFKAQIKTLRFVKKDAAYACNGDKLMKELKPNVLYYCLAHNKNEESDKTAKSQSLGYLHLLPSIYDVKHKKHNIYVEIAKLKSCASDALALIKTYDRHGGDLNETDKDGRSMLMHALTNDNLELIEWLLSKKVSSSLVECDKKHNNILHAAMNHMNDTNVNIMQLLSSIWDNVRGDKQTILSNLSAQYNADGYTPLLLAIKQLLQSGSRSATKQTFLDYFEHKVALKQWRNDCKKKDDARERLKQQQLERWYKQHPIDYVEIDLDEIDFEVLCAEWRVSAKPTPVDSSSLFDNLNTNEQNLFLSSQPISQETEDEEKAIVLNEEKAESDDERAPSPPPMNVTQKVIETFVSNRQLHIDQSTDLHQIFNTKEWNDRKWTLEVTYSLGEYFCTHFTQQNEEDDDDYNHNHFGWGRHQTSPKLTKAIEMPDPRKRDRVKQVYHYRLKNLLKQHNKPQSYILDHLDIKFDGREHAIYVFLCKKLGVKPQFAYPIALRKAKKKKSKEEEEESEDEDMETNDDCYQFKRRMEEEDAESESDYELPAEPPSVVYDKKPKVTQVYSQLHFLSEFVRRCYCDVNLATKLSRSYLAKLEKEEKEICPKTDEELVNMSASKRSHYFDKLTKHKLKLWNVTGPWQREEKAETRLTGYSPLHFAAFFGDFDLVKLFVSFETNPNLITFERKRTALMIHCDKRNDTKIVTEMLKDKRCDVNLSDVEGFAALTYAINFSGRHLHDSERSFRETFQIERLLLKYGANINHIDIYCRSVAHYIFVTLRQSRCYGSRDPIELVSDLCSSKGKGKEKVNVNVADMFGRSPIHYAAMLGAQISSNWLTKEGAKIIGCADGNGNEPFQHSILNKQIALSVDYINQGVDVKHMLYDYKTYQERSSFRQCLELKWMGVAYLMVSRGVEITLAVQDALETENYQLAKTLLYKTQSTNLHHVTPLNRYNLHHIVSKYRPISFQSKQAFEDPWSVRIIEILDEHNVKSKGVLDKLGMSPLHYAVQNGHCALARYYIEMNQLDPERINGVRKERPLITALYNNDIKMVQMLVQTIGIDVEKPLSPHNTRMDGNRVPIHVAATKNNYEMCKILLTAGASTKHEYEYENRLCAYGNGDRIVLHTAIRANNYELAKLMLEYKADVDSTLFYDDLKGYYTCLHLACCKRNEKLIKLLIEYECKMNEKMRYFKMKPLDESIQSSKAKKKEMSRWKREFGAIHEYDGLDECALHIVGRRFNDYALTKLLIEHGADVNIMYRKQLLLNRKDHKTQLNQLFHISTRNDLPDLCLLHTAVRNRDHRMAQLLLENNADANIKMCPQIEHKYGELTALHTAVRNNDSGMVGLLLAAKPKKANPNQLYSAHHCINSDLSSLHTAIRHQNGEMVKSLLKYGADANEAMISDNSSDGELYGIHMSVQNDNIEITRHLLKHGADANKTLNPKRAKYGDVVPLHTAVRCSNYELTQLLLLYGANPNVPLKPKKENEIIWKWRSNAGYKEYDQMLNILIEKQYELFLQEKKEKQKYLDHIKEANKNLINKKKPDPQRIELLDDKIRSKSLFYLRRGTFFETRSNEEYLIDFNAFRQQKQTQDKKKYREVLRYGHPNDIHKDGGSALWMAVRNKDFDIVSLLVNYHCDMNATNKRSETPLIHAIKQNDLTLAAILMRGAVFYNHKYKEKICRGIGRRRCSADDDADRAIKNTKKRTRVSSESHSPSKKRKISKSKYVDGAACGKFIPINVCLKDSAHGFTALHHAVSTDGLYNASFENETMMKLLVNGETLRTQHFLQTKVDAVSPFKEELSSEEVKETDFGAPQRFESAPRNVNINIADDYGNAPIYYALMQKSGKMTACLEDLGARIDETVKEKAEKTLIEKEENDANKRLKCFSEMYDDDILNTRYNVLSDARKWRKEFFIEDDEDVVDAEAMEVDGPAKAEIGKTGYVLQNYNWDGLYVNVDRGKYGAYMFYKMQLLYQPIPKLTILWCRWGRPGERGSFQRTPYQNKAEAIKEFVKIFESKTLNKWEHRHRKDFVPKKWRMVHTKRRRHKVDKKKKSEKEKLTPHNLVNSIKQIMRSLPKQERPKTHLPQAIAEFIYTIFDTAALNSARRTLGMKDNDRLGYVSDQDLDSLYELIQKISDLVQEQEAENVKRRNFENEKYKLEKQMQERNTKRQRHANVFLRNQQRLKQEIQRLNVTINRTATEEEKEEKKNERISKQKQLSLIGEEEEKRKNAEKAAFGPLDEADMKESKEIESKLSELNAVCQERKTRISYLSNEFYVLMPREEFKNTYITAIDRRQLVNKYLKMMMCLNEHQMAISALMGAQYQYLTAQLHPIDYCYISLKCKILPLLADCYDFKLILSYMNRTASPLINAKKVKIFEIYKQDQAEAFEKYRDLEQMLLWHGSNTANVCGILSSGLKIAPPEADATGYMFGKGIYFADAFEKSKNYASTGNRRNTSNLKCLFVCQVAVGKMYEAITAEYMEQPKHSFNSTKGLGQRGPDPSHIKTTFSGQIIPDSPTIVYPDRTTRDKENNIVSVPFFLNWNEYVIYNEQQAILKYLIMLQ
eukprot:258159_1